MLSEQENAIQNFQFHNLTWGSSTRQMNSQFPKGAQAVDGADLSIGERTYAVTADGVDCAILSFLDDRLYQIELLYEPSTVNEIGSWNIILRRLVDKFGRAAAESKGSDTGDDDIIASYYWRLEELKKYISIDVLKKIVSVKFIDLEILWERNDRKEKSANLGF